MNQVIPQVFLVAETSINVAGMTEYFKAIELETLFPSMNPNDESDSEKLVEIAGRMCYRSFVPFGNTKSKYVNPNVTKIREGNKEYIANILKQGHGSVLEHANLTFIFHNISRVFTHELVRHRAGMAYSQESLRYVRLTDIDAWIPTSINVLSNNQNLSNNDPYIGIKFKTKRIFEETIRYLEEVQKELSSIWDIDRIKEFGFKKQLTSMFRRLAPIGLATNIMATGNIRAWRHIIKMRTSESAEEEIRLVFSTVADICKEKFPHFFQDMSMNEKGEYVFENDKV